MSLSTISLRCRSAAASSGMPARPLWHPGWHRTPWEPTSYPRLPTSSTHSVTGGPFGSLDGLSVGRQAGFRQSSFILAESKTIGRASVTHLLSLTHCYTCGGLGLPQPLFLPVEQNPLAAYLLARIPRPVFRLLDLCEEQAPLPIFAFHLAILSPRGPRCSSRAKAET